MKINAYVDGFNFYHGLTEGSPYKWCDLVRLCRLFLPSGELNKVKLFAAYSKEYFDDMGKPKRQNTYLRALRTLPEFEFVPSKFSSFVKNMPLEKSPRDKPEFSIVRGYKEKGADVNLACNLLGDAIRKEYDIAIVITNDSDLVEPIRVARYDLGRKVFLLSPCKKGSTRISKELMTVSNYHKIITEEHLKKSLFPNIVLTKNKTQIHKPKTW